MLTSDSIVGPGGWFVNLSRGFSSTNSHLFSCCCFWWWWLVIFLQGVLKKGLTEFWGLCWEAIFWAKVVISGHVHTLKISGSIMRLKDGLPRKNCCSFGFCPNEGGEGPAKNFCPLFTNFIYWVNLGMGREGETPTQFFLAHWRSKKRGTSCPN